MGYSSKDMLWKVDLWCWSFVRQIHILPCVCVPTTVSCFHTQNGKTPTIPRKLWQDRCVDRQSSLSQSAGVYLKSTADREAWVSMTILNPKFNWLLNFPMWRFYSGHRGIEMSTEHYWSLGECYISDESTTTRKILWTWSKTEVQPETINLVQDCELNKFRQPRIWTTTWCDVHPENYMSKPLTNHDHVRALRIVKTFNQAHLPKSIVFQLLLPNTTLSHSSWLNNERQRKRADKGHHFPENNTTTQKPLSQEINRWLSDIEWETGSSSQKHWIFWS
jgi:hypothetical protein